MNGLALSRLLFDEVVAPIVTRVAPAVRFTAGRFGACSDVLGFDDAISRDHGWGPACTLLLDPAAFEQLAPSLTAALRSELPREFRGHATGRSSIEHDIELSTPERYLTHHLGTWPVRSASDWLCIDEQRLLEVTAGELFRDELDFAAARTALAFYPDDLRRHLIAVEWLRIADEQAFPGRAGSRGDEAGSAIIAARLAESAMRLGFYLERTYPPYAKWFGSAFRRLACASLYDPIARMLAAPAWDARDRAWTDVLRRLLQLHEDTHLLTPDRYQPAPVYAGRPGTGIPAFGDGSIAQLIDELRAPITDPAVLALPRRHGSINQLVAWRDLEEDGARWRAWYATLADR